MPPCEPCQTRLLDYLYDLLDAEERSVVQAHLVGCPACQSALAQADSQRGLLAAAARLEFPEVKFQVPPAAVRPRPVPVAPRDLPGARPRPVRRWGRYAAAAAVLLILSSLVLSGERVSAGHAAARRDADAGAARVAEARTKLDKAAAEVEAAGARRAACVAEWQSARTWHEVPPEAAAAPHEYLTVLATDRPVYRPGLDTIRYRALVLDRFTLRPAGDDFRLVFELTGLDEAGSARTQTFPILFGANALRSGAPGQDAEALAGPDGRPVRGVGAGDFALAADAPEGEYLLTVREANGRFPPQQRTLHVRRPTTPLVAGVEFEHPVYKAGDQVTAYAHPATPEQQVLADRKVRVLVHADGKNYGTDGQLAQEPVPTRTDNFGNLKLDFKLPDKIETDHALLLAEMDDSAEPLVWPIPLSASHLNVTFFPEGGALVPGRANRVFFQCQTPAGTPSFLQGRLLANNQVTEVEVATAADTPGMGVFEVTPRVGVDYRVRVDSAEGAGLKVKLPPATGRVALRVDNAVAAAGQPVRVHVLRTDDSQPLVLALSCRGRLLDTLLLAPGQSEALLQPEVAGGGVLQVSALEEVAAPPSAAALTLACGVSFGLLPQEHCQMVPVARRLVYRHPGDRLQVNVRSERNEQETVLTLGTADEKGRPVPALALLAVTYRGTAPSGDAPNPQAFPVLTELPRPDALEGPDLLLVPGAASDQALDRVLGARPGPAATAAASDPNRRALAQALERTRQNAENKRQSSDEAAGVVAEANTLFAEARNAFEEAQDNPTYRAALAHLAEDGRLAEDCRVVATPVLAGLLVVALLAAGVSSLRRSRMLPWCLVGAACAGLWLAFLLTSSKPTPTPAAPADRPEVALAPPADQVVPQAWPEPPQPTKPETVARDLGEQDRKQAGPEARRNESTQEKLDRAAGGGGTPNQDKAQEPARQPERLGENKDMSTNLLSLAAPKLAEQQKQLPPADARRFPAARAMGQQANPAPPPAAPGVPLPATALSGQSGALEGSTWANRMKLRHRADRSRSPGRHETNKCQWRGRGERRSHQGRRESPRHGRAPLRLSAGRRRHPPGAACADPLLAPRSDSPQRPGAGILRSRRTGTHLSGDRVRPYPGRASRCWNGRVAAAA